MPEIPRQTIEEIRDRTDLIELVGRFVTLKSKGGSWVGLCPFHQEKSPSFNVVPSKGIFHCFGCGEGGDAFKFLMKHKGVSFVEAVKELAGPAGIELEERKLTHAERAAIAKKGGVREACKLASEWFHMQLLTSPAAKDAREYLVNRGLESDTWARFRLGFAPDSWTSLLDHLAGKGVDTELAIRAGLAKRNERRGSHYDVFRGRVIIPILDERDRPIAFGGRILEGDGPKYINSPETPLYTKSDTLYNLSFARGSIQRNKRVLLVEGYFDVISLALAGYPETVATCGTALTPGHMKVLRRLTDRAYALFDADEAGQRASDKSLPLFLDAGMEALRISVPDAKDPDEYIRSQGAEHFEELMKRARPLFVEFLERCMRRNGLSAGGRQRSMNEAIPMLQRLQGTSKDLAIVQAAGILGVPEVTLRRAARGNHSTPTPSPGGHHGARWVGNVELNHLLWLLLNFAEDVAPVLEEVEETALVTERDDVMWVIGQLLGGTKLPEILAQLEDNDVVRVLQASAAKEGLYTQEQAPRVARQILIKLRIRDTETQLLSLRRELSACEGDPDGTKYRVLLMRQAGLQRKLINLRRKSKASLT